uniref:Histidine kinase/HSP90-like ATPase domain-containing protein n=1 Tax=Heterosigma akashiwo TaxID=2829 RepID=A0A7S4D4B0_HETAK
MIYPRLVSTTLILLGLFLVSSSAFRVAGPQNKHLAKNLQHVRKQTQRTFGGLTPLHMTAAPAAESYQFQAEVSRVMDIIINSLYSDRDVFMRELVSNAADACDKKRFLSITDQGAKADCQIKIKADAENNTLIIEDSGVGMTKDELINNLGRIAQSGTRNFMEALGKGEADVNLIGQFGVGFYSAFLVAEQVTVTTKAFQGGDGKQWKWASSAGNDFTVQEDVDGPELEGGSGTRIELKLKEDAEDYLDDVKIKGLLKKYSEFIDFPINLWAEKTTYKQVPDPDAEPPAEGEAPKMKTESETKHVWDRVNTQRPIWLRSPKECTDSEYAEFYKSTFRGYDDPLGYTHFSLEGQVEFKSVLYVPSALPFELSRNMFDEDSRAMKLYVKRVFISDKFEELLPRWLMFVRGVVDSEDLPLNVSREILQKSKILTIISKRLVRKAIDMFKAIKEDEAKFETFTKNYGKYVKVGVIEDDDNKAEIAPLMKFFTSKSGKQERTLGQYQEAMPEGQKAIYYVTGDSREIAEMSPALERCRQQGYEVIYACEPIDELALQNLNKFGELELLDIGKEDVDLGDVGEEEKAKIEEAEKDFEATMEWLGKLFEKKVKSVKLSTKLTESPAALTQAAYGMSPSMQRYMKAQAVAQGMDEAMFSMGTDKAVLELNPAHPVVLSLRERVAAAPDSPDTESLARLMYDVAALTGGYELDSPKRFADRVTAMMSQMAGVDVPAPAAAGGGGAVQDAVVAPSEAKKDKSGEDDAPAAEVEVV